MSARLIAKWIVSAKTTVTKNQASVSIKAPNGACQSTGVTSAKTPIGAKRMMACVIRIITVWAPSQKLHWVSFWAPLSWPMNNPNKIEKQITPSNWPLLLAALTILEGNILKKTPTRSSDPRPLTLSNSPWEPASSLPLPSKACAVAEAMSPGWIQFTTSSPMKTASAPLNV